VLAEETGIKAARLSQLGFGNDLLDGPNLAKGQILANSNPVRPHRRCSPVWS
jgi:hypothetical protein